MKSGAAASILTAAVGRGFGHEVMPPAAAAVLHQDVGPGLNDRRDARAGASSDDFQLRLAAALPHRR
jgi:hypothetical protein